MKFQHYFILFFILIFSSCEKKEFIAIQPNIIPKPLQQTIQQGYFVLDKNTSLETFGEFQVIANFLKSYFSERYNFNLVSNKRKNQILFIKDTSIKNDEGYELKINDKNILITSKTEKGAFYAVSCPLSRLT